MLGKTLQNLKGKGNRSEGAIYAQNNLPGNIRTARRRSRADIVQQKILFRKGKAGGILGRHAKWHAAFLGELGKKLLQSRQFTTFFFFLSSKN